MEDGKIEHYKIEEVISLQLVNDSFWRRFKGSLDFGYNFTKANKDTQFTIDGQIDYISELWVLGSDINLLSSTQNDAEKTKRTDANFKLLRLLPSKWYLLGEVSFLSNTEQALDARVSPSIGVGKYLISTNRLFLGLGVGFTYNN